MRDRPKVTFKLIKPGKDRLWFLTFNKGLLVIAGGGLVSTCFTIIFPHLDTLVSALWISSILGYSITEYYRFDILKNSDYSSVGKISFSKTNSQSISKYIQLQTY